MSVGWLATGDESAKLAEKEKVAAEQRKAEQGKAFRFWIKPGQEASVWFVDGVLSSKGILQPPRFYEHTVLFNGKWDNIVCPQMTVPQAGDKCPICEGKDRPSLVSIFTVLDMTPYTIKSGANEGKVIPYTRKLFVAKPGTFEMLNKLAGKRGGLSGLRIDVSRTKDKAPNVGDVFDVQEKAEGLVQAIAHAKEGFSGTAYMCSDAMKAKFTSMFKGKDKDGKEVMKTLCAWEPLDYSKEIVFRSGDQLRQMGFGAPSAPMPDSAQADAAAAGSVDEYKNEL